MTSRVLPRVSRAMDCWMRSSFSGSVKAVASSSTTMGASFRMARASAMRWHSPPARYTPRAPTTVSSPCGSFATMSSHCAACAAASTSSRVASGRAARMLSSRLCLNSLSFWNTKATRSMSSACGMDRTSTPPPSTRPALASQKRGTSEAAVVLPPPEGPTSATVAPEGTCSTTSSSAGASAPG